MPKHFSAKNKILRKKLSIKEGIFGFAVGVFLVLGIFIFSLYSFAAWTSPTVAPPGGNVPEPINIGTSPQNKLGTFKIGTTTVPASVGNLLLYNGRAAIGTSSLGAASVGLLVANSSHNTNVVDVNNNRIIGLSLVPISNSEAVSRYYADWTASTSKFWTGSTGSNIWSLNSGNIGIGTNNPSSRLHVSSASGNSSNSTFSTSDFVSGTTGSNLFISFGATSGNTTVNLTAANSGGSIFGPMSLSASRFSFSNGNVGIGTSSPSTYRLVVDGSLGVKGNITLAGAVNMPWGDLAEEFYTDKDYPIGTVLIMDDQPSYPEAAADKGYKSATACVKKYDTTVIGVISEKPGLLIGKIEAKYKAPVALTGVIKVRVNDTGGQINRGDLLTTSAVTGEAMLAANPKIGTIIGKALESDTGKGYIMALVNLK